MVSHYISGGPTVSERIQMFWNIEGISIWTKLQRSGWNEPQGACSGPHFARIAPRRRALRTCRRMARWWREHLSDSFMVMEASASHWWLREFGGKLFWTTYSNHLIHSTKKRDVTCSNLGWLFQHPNPLTLALLIGAKLGEDALLLEALQHGKVCHVLLFFSAWLVIWFPWSWLSPNFLWTFAWSMFMWRRQQVSIQPVQFASQQNIEKSHEKSMNKHIKTVGVSPTKLQKPWSAQLPFISLSAGTGIAMVRAAAGGYAWSLNKQLKRRHPP